jgi:hypothetical protein
VTAKLDFERVAGALLPAATVAAVVALVALLGRVGADARWLAALGHTIAVRGSIPAGVPFAAAPSAHWPNALVLAELAFNGLERAFGDRGLMLAQLVAVATAMGLLIRDARAAGADAASSSRSLLIAALGALPALVVVRVQLFSLILFPALLLLLRAHSRTPSRRIWLVVPLLALWSNLHGAALLGLTVVLVYVALCEGRRSARRAICLAVASVAALCATPALLGTVSYYRGLLENVAAQRGEGMWGPLSLSAPLDLVMLACVAALAFRLRRRHVASWEIAVVALLGGLTLRADRNGVWLLFFLLTPGAVAARERLGRGVRWGRLVMAGAPVAVGVLAFALVRGPVDSGASRALVASAISRANGSPVLAEDGIDEQVALAGGTIWMGDPIDAFSRSDQTVYLDWLAGSQPGLRALRPLIRVVLVPRGSATAKLMAGVPEFFLAGGDRNSVLYQRRAAAS